MFTMLLSEIMSKIMSLYWH